MKLDDDGLAALGYQFFIVGIGYFNAVIFFDGGCLDFTAHCPKGQERAEGAKN